MYLLNGGCVRSLLLLLLFQRHRLILWEKFMAKIKLDLMGAGE